MCIATRVEETKLRQERRIRKAFALGLVFLCGLSSLGAAKSELRPPPLEPAEGRRQAGILISNLLSQKPTENASNVLTIKIRDADDHQREVPVRFEVILTSTNFLNTYQTLSPPQQPGSMKLTILHNGEEPNSYWLSEPVDAAPKQLDAAQIMRPFAGSDFWIADLGLEFLHWPQQRVLTKEMRKNVFCDRLESTDPHPPPGGYSRVVSWVGANRPDQLIIVHADAYDARGKLLKEFDPKKVEKVDGAWQLQEMEIRNRQTGSRTRIEFDLSGNPR